MIIKNKRGEIRNILIMLALFLLIIVIVLKQSPQQSAIANRPIGTSQTAILKAAQEANNVLLYVDQAASIAGKETAEELEKNNWQEIDPEGEKYPCGKILEVPYWNSYDKECYPDFESMITKKFSAIMTPLLTMHPKYDLPTYYSLSAQKQDNGKTKITGVSGSKLTINFYGGGKREFLTQAGKTSLEPDYKKAEFKQLLNFRERNGHEVEYVVVHYTVTRDVESAVKAHELSGDSYHYMIDKDGKVYQFVPEDKSAQHAGCSKALIDRKGCLMPGMNQKSIGISFVNCGFDKSCQKKAQAMCDPKAKGKKGHDCWEPYTQEQIKSFEELVADIASRYEQLRIGNSFNEKRMVMHSEISKEKSDPGPAFEEKKEEIITEINKLLQKKLSGTSEEPLIAATGNTIKERREDKITGNSVKNPKRFEEPSPQALARLSQYESIIDKYAKKHDLDPAIIKAIIIHESRAKAEDESTAGALGLMQIVPFSKETGKLINHQVCVEKCGFTPAMNLEEVKKEEYFDPEKNICCGTEVFAQKMKTKKTKKWDCCGVEIDKDICVHTTYTTPYEIGLRYYNGGKCKKWVDPDYVESVMSLYEYFGGNPSQTTIPQGVIFPGKYSIPISFETTINADLKKMNEIKEFAQETVSECKDQLNKCFEEKLKKYNETHPENQLTTNCTDEKDLIKEDFLNKYLGCWAIENNSNCNFTFPYYDYKNTYLQIYLNMGILIQDEMDSKLFIRPEFQVNKYEEAQALKTEQGQIVLTFNPPGKEFNAVIGEKKIINEQNSKNNPLTLYFRKINNNLIYLLKQPENSQKPPATTKIICTQNKKFKLAIMMKDRTPPPIRDYAIKYDEKTKTYAIQWRPETYYDDNEPVTDIKNYEVYCSKENLENHPRNDLPKEKQVSTITNKEGIFDFKKYRTINAITTIIRECDGEPIIPEQEYYIIIIQKDKLGQYNKTYEVIKINNKMTEELPHPMINKEQDNQEYQPETTNPAYEESQETGPVAETSENWLENP